MSTAATVLIPTHNHGPLLGYAVDSVLRQTVRDIELFIVGDGVDESTRVAAMEAARRDSRVRFFDLPKGPRLGELNRHAALADAGGDIICYLSDDDLFLPGHVEGMIAALRDADFAHAAPLYVDAAGIVGLFVGHFDVPGVRERLQLNKWNFIPLSGAAHTRDLYGRLPHGWRTTPPGIWTDLYMWRQILAVEGCRAVTIPRATVVHFPSPDRAEWTLARRVVELASWSEWIARPAAEHDLAAEAMAAMLRVASQLDARGVDAEARCHSLHRALAEAEVQTAELRQRLAVAQSDANLVPELTRHLNAAHAEIAGLREEMGQRQAKSLQAVRAAEKAARQAESAAHEARLASLAHEIESMRQTVTWRWRERLVRQSWLAAVVRAVARAGSRPPKP